MFAYFSVIWSFFFFKQKTAYEMRISDWSSDVCSSDLPPATTRAALLAQAGQAWLRAEEPDRAYAVQTTALDLLATAGKPRAAVEIRIDRAVTLAAKGR